MITKTLTGTLLDDQVYLSLEEVCEACSARSEWVVELVEEGILEPSGEERRHWQFSGTCLSRAQTAMRLQSDLEVNLAGVAVVLDLMEKIQALESCIRRNEPL